MSEIICFLSTPKGETIKTSTPVMTCLTFSSLLCGSTEVQQFDIVRATTLRLFFLLINVFISRSQTK